MKKLNVVNSIFTFAALAATLTLTSCKPADSTKAQSQKFRQMQIKTPADKTLKQPDQPVADQKPGQATSNIPQATPPPEKKPEPITKIDLDFTRMGKTMQLTHAIRLMSEPEEFIGKAIRVSGTFQTYQDDDGSRVYGCSLSSMSGCSCCSPGILEFEAPVGSKWPQDFPVVDGPLTVTGRMKIVAVKSAGATYEIPRLGDTQIICK